MEKTVRKTLMTAVVFLFSFQIFAAGCAPVHDIKKPTYGRGSSHTSSNSRPTATSSRNKRRYHYVKKGENLYRIAKRYKTSVAAIKKANRIYDSTKLEVGQKLIIPYGKYVARGANKKPSKRKSGSTTRKSGYVKKGVLAWPLKKYTLTSRFGIRGAKKHDGIDLSAPKGTPIYAAASGKVIFSGRGPSGYGKIVIIKHSRSLITVYAHNRKNLVRQGERVKSGQNIATVGNSGRASGYHLHFEVRKNRQPTDPLRYLPLKK